MTRKQALAELIAKVEAGEFDVRTYSLMKLPKISMNDFDNIHASYQGSLDAALALHEAALPEWTASVGQNAHHADWNAWVRLAQDGTIEQEFTASLDTPARAWLLAILKALHAQETGE